MILLLDNYDSFTYNLYQYLAEHVPVRVVRNDAASVEELLAEPPRGVVVSPGPGRPEGAGVTEALIRAVLGRIPLLGVCLGHQALVQVCGGRIVHARMPMHGKASRIVHQETELFEGCPNPMEVGRYHSLLAESSSLPDCLEVTAMTLEMEIMAVRHRKTPAWGVQFHPESILTPEGMTLVRNFLRLCGVEGNDHVA